MLAVDGCQGRQTTEEIGIIFLCGAGPLYFSEGSGTGQHLVEQQLSPRDVLRPDVGLYTDDVMRCFQLKNVSAAYMRISRLQRDHLIEKDEDFVDGGTTKSRYRKTGVLMC